MIISVRIRRDLLTPTNVGFLLVVILLSFPLSSGATDYFVDNQDEEASDSNEGTEASPWETIGECASTLVDGDRCVVKNTGGTYAGFAHTTSGLPGKRITYLAESGGIQARISSSVNVRSSEYITIDGFYFDGATINGEGCSFIQIMNNTIDKTGSGITGLEDCNDVLISDNVFENITNDAVNQWGYRWTIRNNIVLNEVDSEDSHFDFWQSWCPSDNPTRVPADFTLVENNLYAEIAGGNVHFFLFHETTRCGSDAGTNFIIRHNQIRHIGSNGVTFDNDSGAPGFEGVAVYNNVFGELGEGSHPSWRDYIGGFDDASGTAFFFNNILYDAVDPTGAEAVSPPSVPADCTLAYDPDHDITTDGALESSSGSIVNRDPLFNDYSNNDFSLDPDSPAIDAGCPLTIVASSDAGSGTSLVVENPWFFAPGWGEAEPDCIAVGSVENTACIVSINYATGTLTLDSSIDRDDADSVWLYKDSDGTVVLFGAATDIGAVEYSGLCDGVVCSALDECHDVGTCDSDTGDCSNPELDDYTSCTLGVCMGGVCTEVTDGDGDGDGDTHADGDQDLDGDVPLDGDCRVVEELDDAGNPGHRIVCDDDESRGCACSATPLRDTPDGGALFLGLCALVISRRCWGRRADAGRL